MSTDTIRSLLRTVAPTPRPTCDEAALGLILDYEAELKRLHQQILTLRAERDEARRVAAVLDRIEAKLNLL